MSTEPNPFLLKILIIQIVKTNRKLEVVYEVHPDCRSSI